MKAISPSTPKSLVASKVVIEQYLHVKDPVMFERAGTSKPPMFCKLRSSFTYSRLVIWSLRSALLSTLIEDTFTMLLLVKVVRPVLEIKMLSTCCNEVTSIAVRLVKAERYKASPIEVRLAALREASDVAPIAVKLPVMELIPLRLMSPVAVEFMTMLPSNVLHELISFTSEFVVIVFVPEHCASMHSQYFARYL